MLTDSAANEYCLCKLSNPVRVAGYQMFCNLYACEEEINSGVAGQVEFQVHSVAHAPWPPHP